MAVPPPIATPHRRLMPGRWRRLRAAAAGHLLAGVVRLWRLCCRYTILGDPRPALRLAQQPYIYALLHGHQVAAVLANDEHRLMAMVSRSADGDLLVPILRARGVQAVRGSSHRGGPDRGGSSALWRLRAGLRTGVPALLAVDGPRGPHGHVQPGVIALAQATGATLLPVVATASHGTVLRRSWDRLQLPWPGSRITLQFGAPIPVARARAGEEAARRAALRLQVEVALAALARPK